MNSSYLVESNKYFRSYKIAIVFEEIEKWFFWSRKNRQRQSGYTTFWKFMNPAKKHKAYKKGDSWQEATGLERRAFNRAFEKIGIRYRSKTSFMDAADKFQGKPFACYFDRKSAQMTFVRNDLIADQLCRKIRFGENNNKYYGKSNETSDVDNGRSRNVDNCHRQPPPTRARIYNNTNTTTTNATIPQNKPSVPSEVDVPSEQLSLVGKIIEVWNTEMRDNISNSFSTSYVRKVIDIFREWFKNSLDEWKRYCYQMASSKFCRGEATNTKFKAFFTWAVKPETIQKIRNGLYGVMSKIETSIPKSLSDIEAEKISHEILCVEKLIERSRDEIVIAQNIRITEEINSMSADQKEKLMEKFNLENPTDGLMDWFTRKIYTFKSTEYLRDHVRKQLNFCLKDEIKAPEDLIKLRQDLLDKQNQLLNNSNESLLSQHCSPSQTKGQDNG
jgi:hypothetical protein